jgi:hypothetical protein
MRFNEVLPKAKSGRRRGATAPQAEAVKSLFIFPEYLEGLGFSATMPKAKNQSLPPERFINSAKQTII